MGFVARVRAKFGKARPPLTLSTVDVTRVPSKTAVGLPDGTADLATSRYRPPASIAELDAGAATLGSAPLVIDGTPVRLDVIEAGMTERLAKRPEVVVAARNAHVNDPVATTAASLEQSKGGWAATLKSVLINNFIVIALAGAVGTYFLVTAEKRRKCIKEVFAKYPQFMDADAVEKLMATYNNQPCGTTNSAADRQCAAVHDAYQTLKDCDNTLMKNILAAGLNAGADVTDFAGDQADKMLEKLSGMFSGVLPIILGVVGAIILVCIALWFVTRPKGEGAQGTGRFIGNVRGRFRRFRGGAVEQAEQAFGKHMRSAARGFSSSKTY